MSSILRFPRPLLLTALLCAAPALHAQDIAVPFEFRAGDTALADEVNQNFAALVDAAKDLRAELDTLRGTVEGLVAENTELREDLTTLQGLVGTIDVVALQALTDDLKTDLEELDDKTQFLSVTTDDLDGLRGPHMIVEGANLHIRSGSGVTDDGGTSTGMGNLILGYNEPATTVERVGSHNLVIGARHSYPTIGGIVAGTENTISGASAAVLGGTRNTASGIHAVVSGGSFNQATGEESSVSGGVSNFATALRSAASGGAQNTVSGTAASITGGSGGAAGGFASSISGGQSGIASGDQSSVSGGQSNSAFGNKSAVSGGFNQTVTDDFDWRACDVTCE